MLRLKAVFICSGRYRCLENEESPGNYYVALELDDPQAIDAATYRLNARNQFGESNANLKLNFDGNFHIISFTTMLIGIIELCSYVFLDMVHYSCQHHSKKTIGGLDWGSALNLVLFSYSFGCLAVIIHL